MLISVDLPAPFSPTMPWIEPRATDTLTARFACTGPKRLSMLMSSTAGAPPVAGAGLWPAPATFGPAPGDDGMPGLRAGVVRRVVVHLDLAGDDVLLCVVDLGLHRVTDQRLVELVECPVDAFLLEAEHLQARRPGAFLGCLEGVVRGEIDALHH